MEIKGICLSALDEYSVESLSTFMNYEGMDGIMIGADKEATDFPGKSCFHEYLAKNGPADVFLGYEIGIKVQAGGTIPDGDLLRKVLILHNDFNGRDAWDPMTVYMACLGNPEKAGTATSLLKKAPM